ncbi:MAG TPA: GNAT family N-acetyltransferase [Pseudonocardiaceae bacterium]|jgi:RimJ/RimL family protein N-acetyltransferase|nr:GNAT family N-acetyltransferase [Pseudonocardiaceae bacterium]
MEDRDHTRRPQATWRLRVELTDRPGALARLTTALAARNCNILALTVFPVPGAVVDDVIISTPAGLLPTDLVKLIRGAGGRCAGVTRADMHSLTDGPTAALRTATRLAAGSIEPAEALRDLLGADSVRPIDGPADRRPTSESSRAVVPGAQDGRSLAAHRSWTPFTEVELARSAAMAELVRALEPGRRGRSAPRPPASLPANRSAANNRPVPGIRRLPGPNGPHGLVLRPGRPTDTDAVAAMHERCSRATLFARYHAGTRTMPRQFLHRLLTPPRGQAIVGQIGPRVVALGQVVSINEPNTAEISLLVEDGWQKRGVGTAMLTHLARTARDVGCTELVAWCMANEQQMLRTAEKAGLLANVRYEGTMMRLALNPHGASAPATGAPSRSSLSAPKRAS